MNIEKLKLIYEDYLKRLPKFTKMGDYYNNQTDAMKLYKMITDRSSLKTNTNFIKLFIDEEVSYSLGNDITYSSRSDDQELIKKVNYAMTKLSSSHDIRLLSDMLTYSIAYELYYIDRDGDFNSKVILPTDGTAVLNAYGDVELFLHMFKKPFDETDYIDVYDSEYIHHYDTEWNVVAQSDRHVFGEVPVGIASWDKERDMTENTIFAVSKGLQDAYETNMSDLSNEISDFRNAYMIISGGNIDDEDLPKMKEMGVLKLPPGTTVEWLMKDLQGRFIHDTLENIEDKLYQLNGHINRNERNNANESFLAIEAKNMTLQSKAKLNQKGLEDCIKSRLKMLVNYINFNGTKTNYDYKDIYPIFVANLPADDFSVADMINKLGDRISNQTALGQLSFIKDPASEVDRITEEQAELAKRLKEAGESEDSAITEALNEEVVE